MNKGLSRRRIVLNGQDIEYELQRKQVKNINLRIRQDGTVYVSASPTVSLTVIEKFMQSRSGLILSAIEGAKLAQRPLNDPAGDSITVLGRVLPVTVVQGAGEGVEQKNGRLTGIFTTGGTFPCEALVFAVGHSARDTFGMLMDSGLVLECKPFSVGFRAEHLQSEIEKSLYHEAAGHPALPRGEYQLSQHVGDRCVYTFCMCPGGQVVASASETGHVVTNGMSYHARDGKNANAAVVVSVGAEDFAGDPRRAIAFQRELEAKAYAAGCRGGAYAAPAENVQSFLEGKGQLNIGRVEPTYDRGVVAADLGALLPGELADTLRAGLRAYERKIAGYTAPEAILTGLETRTSSPVRLKREETLESAQLAGLYPCGEGAGYAGGIMSAAVDGLRVARAIIGRYAPAEG